MPARTGHLDSTPALLAWMAGRSRSRRCWLDLEPNSQQLGLALGAEGIAPAPRDVLVPQISLSPVSLAHRQVPPETSEGASHETPPDRGPLFAFRFSRHATPA